MPKLTSPLAKAIRTLEGWLVILVNAGLTVGASLDPHSLPPKTAGILAAANTGLLVASRTLLKLFAAQPAVGIAAPIPVEGTAKKIVDTVEHGAEQAAGDFVQWHDADAAPAAPEAPAAP